MRHFFTEVMVAVGGMVAILLYAILAPRTYHYTASFAVHGAHPRDVWDFVADFSNMPKLNPTILNWELLSESHDNKGLWRYSVRYTENLSGLPSVTNYATADFEVRAVKPGADYVVTSTHSTCFYSDLLCLPTVSKFRFLPHAEGALCVEDIDYACPWLFSSFCHREVVFQREAIRENLQSELDALDG